MSEAKGFQRNATSSHNATNKTNNNAISREPSIQIQTGGTQKPYVRRQMSTTVDTFGNGDGPSGDISPLSNADRSTTLPSNTPPHRNPQYSEVQQQQYAESNLDRRSLSQFNPATLDNHSIHSRRTLSKTYRCDSCLNLNAGAIVLYDPLQQAVVPTQMNQQQPPQYLPQNYWYSAYPPPPPPFFFGNRAGSPPPPPPDFETFRKAMKMEKKMMKAEQKKNHSACGEFCCGGVAQLLWIIIAITCIGFFAAFILALFVV